MYPVLSEKQKEMLISRLALKHQKYALLARLGFLTGLRIGDLLKLKYEHFEKSERYLEITESKTKKKRRIKITKVMREMVMGLKRAHMSLWEEFIFTGRYEYKPMHRSTACKIMRQAGIEIGVRGLGSHSLRKTYAIELYKSSGGNLERVQKELNHKYKDTTLKSYVMSGIKEGDILGLYLSKKE